MKIFYTSDLHIDCWPIAFTLADLGVDIDTYDVFVLAGDLTNGQPSQLEHFLKPLAHKPVIMVLGNHDYWNNEFGRVNDKFKKWLEEEGFYNCHLLDNENIVVDDVVFVGGTLWTDVATDWHASNVVRAYMPDCSRIIGLKGLLTTNEMHSSHIECLQAAQRVISVKKKIFVTHHCLSKQSLSPFYRDASSNTTQLLNRGYYSELDEWIESQGFDAIISGHTHASVNYKIGSTKMLANPLGYPGDEVADFNQAVCLEI